MTTYINFLPTAISPFRFQTTLDSALYNAVITWNLNQRWYINIYDLRANLIAALPVIGSPNRIPVTLTTTQGSLFCTISPSTGPTGEYTPIVPGSIGLGTTVISTNVPSGTIVEILAGSTLLLNLPSGADPISNIITGVDDSAQISGDINIIQGYFRTSTLVFRGSTNQFEISP